MIGKILVGFIAIQHLGFLVLEMFLWTHPVGLKVFRQSLEKAQASQVLAANQGLYNGFLAAGLIWSLCYGDAAIARQLSLFFCGCVLIAGLYGGWSVSWRISLIQGGPALMAIVYLLISDNL